MGCHGGLNVSDTLGGPTSPVNKYLDWPQLYARDQAAMYIANTGNIQQNPWMSRVQHLDSPDFLVFDLDPVEAPYSTVQKVAIVLKGVLDELGLRGYPKTSGATGIHVHLPVLENTFTYEDVRTFAGAVAAIALTRPR